MVNKNLELNIQTIPKPIKYKFKDSRRESDRKDRKSPAKSSEKKEANGESDAMEIAEESRDGNENSQDVVASNDPEKGNESEVKCEDESVFDNETSEPAVKKEDPASQLSDSKAKVIPRLPKYGVKVVMLSLPSLNELYEEVCGYDFTKQVTRNHNTYFNRLVSFLSFKNQNNGYSLVGGKFNLDLDGYM